MEAETIERLGRRGGLNGEVGSPPTLYVDEVPLGAGCRQGDLYLLRIAAVPEDAEPTDDQQLAPGRRPGARHRVVGRAEVFRRTRLPDALHGPVVVGAARFLVGHPEHAGLSLPPGIYQVRYQRRYTGVRGAPDASALD
jgi:hypothetical protein